jgi:hypothetical protein
MVQFVPCEHLKFKLFFNVSTPVGAGAKGSRRADILLVQFYFVLHHHADGPTGEAYRKVKLTGVCDGDLIAAIRAFQASHSDKLVVDGLVSRARGTHFGSDQGTNVWTIVRMGGGFWAYCLPLWPRIDRHPQCSGELGQAIREALGAVW